MGILKRFLGRGRANRSGPYQFEVSEVNMRYPTLMLVSVMLGAGALGGFMNYLMLAKEDRESRSFLKSLVLGIGASFMVPLLLNMISSNLMELARGDKGAPADAVKLLVFVGICLVAAVFSTRFIQTIADRVLREAQDAKERAARVEKEVKRDRRELQPVLDRLTEQPEPSSTFDAQQVSVEKQDGWILRALADEKFAYRFTTGVTQSTGLPRDEVERRLTDLVKHGLAGKKVRPSDGQVLWYLTDAGRHALPPEKAVSEGPER